MRNILGAVVILLGVSSPVWAEADRVINVTGHGVVETVPDLATMSVGVTREARIAGDALDATSQAMQDIIRRLQTDGIDARDMQTQGLSLQPKWSRPASNGDAAPQIIGFIARNTLSLRVRDLAVLGDILNTVVEDGANTFNGLQFSVADPDAAFAAARADAVRDAVAKAGQLAEAAGVSLGEIQSISESGGRPQPVMMEMASARMADAVPVAQGEVSLSAQVSIVFAIADN